MSWKFQVRIWDKQAKRYVWHFVHPVGDAPYSYATKEEAEKNRHLCYGNDTDNSRVIEWED